MAVFIRQGDEIAFRIDDDLLYPGRRLLQQAAQKMRLSRTGIALNKQTRRQKLLDIELGRRTAGHSSHIDADLHYAALVCRRFVFCRQSSCSDTERRPLPLTEIEIRFFGKERKINRH
ncbi:hypothetical protein D3C80_482130 [compost metagenome]